MIILEALKNRLNTLSNVRKNGYDVVRCVRYGDGEGKRSKFVRNIVL